MRATAALLVVLGSSSHCDTVSWCPSRDFPALILENALKLKLAVEAELQPHEGQLEQTPSKGLQPLLHGFYTGERLKRHLSPSVGHSSNLDIWAAACSGRIVFPQGTGCFQPCAEPAPIEQLRLLK